MGLILALDQIQSMFTQRSMFSAIVAPFVVAAKGSAEGWTPEQQQEQLQRFNIWTPFSRTKDAISSVLNSLWSTFFTLMLIYGPKLPGLFKRACSWLKGKITGSVPSTSATLPTPKGVQESFRHEAMTKGMNQAYGEAFNSLTSVTDPCLRQTLIKALDKAFETFWKTSLLKYLHIAYKAVYVVKQVVGGLISPTEWIELGISAFTWSLWGGFRFADHPKWTVFVNFIWNWGDNFYFAWLEQETTLGLFYWLGAAAQGDFAGATIWDTSSPY